MGLQKVAFNFMVERGEKLVKSLLCSKPAPKPINLKDLKYLPALKEKLPEQTNKFLVTDSEFSLLSSSGENLSSIFYMKEKGSINILDIASVKSGCGYGTALLQKFIDIFNNHKIELAACWEKFVSPLPPHKFYMQNGFVPTDKNAKLALKEWISKGGNPKDFPNKYELCKMVRNPTLKR